MGSPVAPIELTNSEATQLRNMRALLADFWADEATPPGKSEALKHQDDTTLLRFVQARPSVEEAATMYRGAMAWRESVDVERLYATRQAPLDMLSPAQRLAESTFYGLVIGGTHAGGPIMYERLGRVDLAGIAREPGLSKLVEESYIAYLEKAWRAVRCSKDGRRRALVVVDLDGLGYAHLRHAALIKGIAAIGPPNYPEITVSVAIVRAPRIVNALWSIVAPMLPEATRRKVAFYGADYLARLGELVPPEQIPTFLGGSCWVGEDRAHPAALLLQRSCTVEPGIMAKLELQ